MSGVPRLTAITTSAPIVRAMLTGRLSVSPPSTKSFPSISTGSISPGTDMLARMTLASSPELNTTALPVTRSVAIARNGIGSSSNLRNPCALASARSTVSSCTPDTMPFGRRSWPARKPRSGVKRVVKSSYLRRIERSSRGGFSLNSRSVDISPSVRSISATVMPDAKAPPTIDPMLVPAMQSIGHAQLLEHFQHAHVGGAACTAAGEH